MKARYLYLAAVTGLLAFVHLSDASESRRSSIKAPVAVQGVRPGDRLVVPFLVSEALQDSEPRIGFQSGAGEWVTLQAAWLSQGDGRFQAAVALPRQRFARALLKLEMESFPGETDEVLIELGDSEVPEDSPGEPVERRVAKAMCGVQSMDVLIAGQSGIAVQPVRQPNGTVQLVPIGLGSHDTVPATLQGTRSDARYDYYFGFEVVTKLVPGSATALCRETQLLQGIHRIDGRIIAPEGNRADPDTWADRPAGPCVFDSGDWCRDVYDAPGEVAYPDGSKSPIKKHLATEIRWFDGAGFTAATGHGIAGRTLFGSQGLILALDTNGHVIPDAFGQPERYESGNWARTRFRAHVRGTEGQPSWLCTFVVRFRVTSDPSGQIAKPIPPTLTDKECGPEPV